MSKELTLYFHTSSPPARAVYLLAKYLKLDFEVKNVDIFGGDQFAENYSKLNPLQKIPVLIDGDFVLGESRSIMTYLVNSRKPGSDLYPSDPKSRALVDQKLYYDGTILLPALRNFVIKAFERGYKDVIFEELKDDIKRALKTLNSFLEGNEYFAGKNLTVADISILPSVTSFAEWGYDLSVYPNLKKWYEKLHSLPSFDKNLEGAKALTVALRSRYEGQVY